MSSFHYELDRATEHLSVTLVILENFLNTSRLSEIEDGKYLLNVRESINGGRAGSLIEVPYLNGDIEPFCSATLDPVYKLLGVEESDVGKIAREIIDSTVMFNQVYETEVLPMIRVIKDNKNLESMLIPSTLYSRINKIEKLTEKLIDVWSEIHKG